MQLIGPEPPLVHHRDIERYGELIIETVDMIEKSIVKKMKGKYKLRKK